MLTWYYLAVLDGSILLLQIYIYTKIKKARAFGASIMGQSKSGSPEPKISDGVNTSSVSPMHALAYGLGGHFGSGLADSALSIMTSRYEQKQQRKLMQQQMNLQREMTRNQMADERESYLRAGLSPALLAEGGFSPAQVDTPAPAMQNISGKNPDTTARSQQAVLNNSLLEQKATIENIEEQTAGQKLKNDEQEIVNERLRDEDEVADTNIRLYMQNIINALPEGSELREHLENKYSNSDWRFTQGSIRASQQFVELLHSDTNMSVARRKNELDGLVYQYMRNDPSVVSALVHMPEYEVAKVNAYIKEVSSVVSRNLSEVALNTSQGEVNQAVIEKIAGELRAIGYNIESAQLGDSRYLLKHGRGADLAANVFMNGLDFSADVMKMYLGGRGFASGRALGSATGNAPPIVSPSTQKAMDKLPKVSDLSRGQKYSAKELASIPVAQRKQMAQIEFNTFRYEHPRMGEASLRKMHEKIGAKYGLFKNPQNRLRR